MSGSPGSETGQDLRLEGTDFACRAANLVNMGQTKHRFRLAFGALVCTGQVPACAFRLSRPI